MKTAEIENDEIVIEDESPEEISEVAVQDEAEDEEEVVVSIGEEAPVFPARAGMTVTPTRQRMRHQWSVCRERAFIS